MDKIYSICYNCGNKYCYRGSCKELNDYLVKKIYKSCKTDSKYSKIK